MAFWGKINQKSKLDYVYEVYQGIGFRLFPVGPVITGAMLGDTFYWPNHGGASFNQSISVYIYIFFKTKQVLTWSNIPGSFTGLNLLYSMSNLMYGNNLWFLFFQNGSWLQEACASRMAAAAHWLEQTQLHCATYLCPANSTGSAHAR